MHSSDYTLDKQQAQNIKSLLKILDKAIEVAFNKIENENRQHDEKVYYSSLALKNLLESLLSEKYMQVTGGFSPSLAKDFNCIEYGKQVAVLATNTTKLFYPLN